MTEPILLQPTYPLRKLLEIYNIIETKLERNCKSIVSITEAYIHTFFSYKILKNGELSNFMGSLILKILHELSKAFSLNSFFYFANRNFLIKKNSFLDEGTIRFFMEQDRSIDIYNNYDWEITEMLFMKSL